jgi:RNA polymerase sigma factor (sigma-70 family)
MESSASQSLDRLLERAREGSRSAVDRLMVWSRPWLRERVRAWLPRKLARRQDGSDLVQECQYRAAAQLAQFEGRSLGEFRAWMLGILKHLVLRVRRREGEKRRDWKRDEPLRPAWCDPEELAEARTSDLGRLCQEEARQRLELAASWCREEDRAVIKRHLFEGRSHDEIAAEWGISVPAARQRYCRAVRRVGAALQLLERMSQRGIRGPQQEVIGLHRFQGVEPGQIADRLRLPEELVRRWIVEAGPLLRGHGKDQP